MRVIFHPEARLEHMDAATYYKRRDLSAGRRFQTALLALVKRISVAPLQFPITSGYVRTAVLNDFPYVVHFESFEDYVYILAVAHASRGPLYWADRL